MLTKYRKLKIEDRWSKLRLQIVPEDRQTISTALRLAADQYTKDADANANDRRVSEQFSQQANECTLLADILEL